MELSSGTVTLAHLLIDGAVKVFANAEALYSEATILANAEAWPRALFLHQISLEECAKIEMLAAAVTSLLLGHEVDLKQLGRVFSQHSRVLGLAGQAVHHAAVALDNPPVKWPVFSDRSTRVSVLTSKPSLDKIPDTFTRSAP